MRNSKTRPGEDVPFGERNMGSCPFIEGDCLPQSGNGAGSHRRGELRQLAGILRFLGIFEARCSSFCTGDGGGIGRKEPYAAPKRRITAQAGQPKGSRGHLTPVRQVCWAVGSDELMGTAERSGAPVISVA